MNKWISKSGIYATKPSISMNAIFWIFNINDYWMKNLSRTIFLKHISPTEDQSHFFKKENQLLKKQIWLRYYRIYNEFLVLRVLLSFYPTGIFACRHISNCIHVYENDFPDQNQRGKSVCLTMQNE